MNEYRNFAGTEYSNPPFGWDILQEYSFSRSELTDQNYPTVGDVFYRIDNAYNESSAESGYQLNIKYLRSGKTTISIDR
ncbi:Replicase polyprotein 1ab [Dirofilaria immitis]